VPGPDACPLQVLGRHEREGDVAVDPEVNGRSGWAKPRSARSAGAFGNAVEWYDFAVLGASATLVADALTPGGSQGLTSVFAIFGLALLMRPVGALAGAAWADRAGRRLPLIVTVFGMSLATAGIAVLPTWATAGALTVVLLLVLRVVQGLSTGAELVVSVAYLVEHAPPGRRGAWGSLHMATIAVGFAAGSAAVATMSAALTPESLTTWGWRVPFAVALPLGYAVFRVRRRATETPAFHRMSRDVAVVTWRRPWVALAPERGKLLAGFLLTAAFMSSFTLWFVFLPAHLSERSDISLHVALVCAAVGLVVMAGSALACGHASDTWGRRPVIAAAVAITAITWVVGYPALADGPVWVLLAVDVTAGVGLGGFVLQSTLAELFPAPVRTAGIAVTFGLASALVGGTSPLTAELLARVSPALVSAYALVWLLAAAGATAALGNRIDDARQGALDDGLPPATATSPQLRRRLGT
jgi:MFS transporter, MHS family, proline/betaine transporter